MVNPIIDACKHLSGPYFDELLSSKSAALSFLSHEDRNVRLAAIYAHGLLGSSATDADFIAACCAVAQTDPDTAVRDAAVTAIGSALAATRDVEISRFLANLTAETRTPPRLREASYWALREVQLGLQEYDLVRRSVALVKAAFQENKYAGSHAREALRPALASAGAEWESVEKIDWDFVDQFITARGKKGSGGNGT